MFFEPLYGINYQNMPGLETMTLTHDHRPMQATPYDQASGSAIPLNSLGMLYYDYTSATAWISNVLPTPFRFRIDNGIEYNAVAVAVTTAHTILMKGAYPAIWKFFTDADPNNSFPEYCGVALTDFVDHISDFKDPINLNSYSISDDIMLFLILECPHTTTRLSSMTVAPSPILKDTAVSIFGYPVYTSLEQVYPLGVRFPLSEQDVRNAIAGGSKLVRSDGAIKEVGELCAVSCTTASGMSGSPVVILENGIAKVVGILCGGPAAPLHRTLIRILIAAKNQEWNIAEVLINDLERFADLSYFISQDSFNQMKLIVFRKIRDPCRFIMRVYVNLLVNYASRVDEMYLNHNLMLPVTSPGFQMAMHCSHQLTTDAELYSRVVTHEFLLERLKFYKTLRP
jgi:hypothetical protein